MTVQTLPYLKKIVHQCDCKAQQARLQFCPEVDDGAGVLISESGRTEMVWRELESALGQRTMRTSEDQEVVLAIDACFREDISAHWCWLAASVVTLALQAHTRAEQQSMAVQKHMYRFAPSAMGNSEKMQSYHCSNNHEM